MKSSSVPQMTTSFVLSVVLLLFVIGQNPASCFLPALNHPRIEGASSSSSRYASLLSKNIATKTSLWSSQQPTTKSYSSQTSSSATRRSAFPQNNNSKNNKNNDNKKIPVKRTTTSTANTAPAKTKTQLHWILSNLEKSKARLPKRTFSDVELVEAMAALTLAKTPQHVIQAGRRLQALNIAQQQQEPVHIQERIAKATAMTGLFHIALNITDGLLSQNIVPSEVCQDAIARGLRQAGKLKQLERFLMDVGSVAVVQQQKQKHHQKDRKRHNMTATTTADSPQTSLYAYNIFLAALCDPIVNKQTERSFYAPQNPQHLLEKGLSWLYPHRTRTLLNLEPNSVSYATLLNAASQHGNQTLTNMIWNQCQDQRIPLNTNIYNVRLKSAKTDEEALDIWNEMTENHSVRPDKYSIDLILLPLLRAGRVGDVEGILDQFIDNYSPDVVSNAFTAFLLTLTQPGGDVESAHAIFDTYLKPSLSALLTVPHGEKARWVQPKTRHFNALIEGYKQRYIHGMQQQQKGYDNITNINSMTDDTTMELTAAEQENTMVRREEARTAGWKLYNLMLQQPSTQPDDFAVASMFGLCSSPSELTTLLGQAIQELGLNCSSALLRAAITRYGELGDPSSACRLFVEYVDFPVTTRYWNVLLGALAKCTEHTTADTVIDTRSANVATILSEESASLRNDPLALKFLETVNGRTCCDALKELLPQVENPNSQTYCVVARGLQYGPADSNMALELFRNATSARVPADGRFVNAIIRCFGGDINAAVNAWKSDIRSACVKYENRSRSKPVPSSRTQGKNLVAAYNGLIYVAGRALRPDIALRLVYAMGKEGLEADETSLNCYRAGKRRRKEPSDKKAASARESVTDRLRKILRMVEAYESLLYVECVRYDQNDKRRLKEKRVRIIL